MSEPSFTLPATGISALIMRVIGASCACLTRGNPGMQAHIARPPDIPGMMATIREVLAAHAHL